MPHRPYELLLFSYSASESLEDSNKSNMSPFDIEEREKKYSNFVTIALAQTTSSVQAYYTTKLVSWQKMVW